MMYQYRFECNKEVLDNIFESKKLSHAFGKAFKAAESNIRENIEKHKNTVPESIRELVAGFSDELLLEISKEQAKNLVFTDGMNNVIRFPKHMSVKKNIIELLEDGYILKAFSDTKNIDFIFGNYAANNLSEADSKAYFDAVTSVLA